MSKFHLKYILNDIFNLFRVLDFKRCLDLKKCTVKSNEFLISQHLLSHIIFTLSKEFQLFLAFELYTNVGILQTTPTNA